MEISEYPTATEQKFNTLISERRTLRKKLASDSAAPEWKRNMMRRCIEGLNKSIKQAVSDMFV